jgi:hypothetical protein
MESSFLKDDVILLLKDITGLVNPLPTDEREKCIQNGTHYSEMLPLEYKPTADYIRIYEKALEVFGQTTADAVARVSDRIVASKGKDVVIVSLARAGTPLGILIRRYIRTKYGFECPHYSISIIRDRGIDRNAVDYILQRYMPGYLQFVDGWTGKGVIYRELQKELTSFAGVSNTLAVLADPAYLTNLCGTHDDILIPSSCLNSTVCGLISRTLLRRDIIGEKDFHGAVWYKELSSEDRTYEFIDYIEKRFRFNLPSEDTMREKREINDIEMLSRKFRIENINYIKPGIGETTRVLLRRVPWKVVINECCRKSQELDHIRQLAIERNVEVEYVHLNSYKCCGLIKRLTDI